MKRTLLIFTLLLALTASVVAQGVKLQTQVGPGF